MAARLADTASAEEVLEVVKRHLLQLRRYNAMAASDIAPETSLVADLGFDSLSMIEVATVLEEAFAIEELPLNSWRERESDKAGARYTVASLVELCLHSKPLRP